jgi:hypothetical protein
MSAIRLYFIDLKVGLEFEGDDLPCEEVLLTPIKKFIKAHIKVYKKTTRIVIMNSKLCEVGYEETEETEEQT